MPASRQGTISANCLTFLGIRNTIAQISIPAATNGRAAAEPKLLALRCNEWRFRQRAVLIAGSKVQLDGCYDALRYFKAQPGTADPIDLELRQKNCRYVTRRLRQKHFRKHIRLAHSSTTADGRGAESKEADGVASSTSHRGDRGGARLASKLHPETSGG